MAVSSKRSGTAKSYSQKSNRPSFGRSKLNYVQALPVAKDIFQGFFINNYQEKIEEKKPPRLIDTIFQSQTYCVTPKINDIINKRNIAVAASIVLFISIGIAKLSASDNTIYKPDYELITDKSYKRSAPGEKYHYYFLLIMLRASIVLKQVTK